MDTLPFDARQQLRESAAWHALLLENIAQAVWEADPTGVVVTDSPSWRAYTGQTRDEWFGYGWLNAIHPDDRAFAERQWRAAMAASTVVDAEFRLRSPDGGWCWTNVRAVPVADAAGNILKWTGMNIDIDARKRAEEALRDSAGRQAFMLRFSDALRTVSDETVVFDLAARMLAEELAIDRCYVAIIDPEHDRTDVVGQFAAPALAPMPPSLPGLDFPVSGAWARGGTVIVDDTANDPRLTDTDRYSLAAMDFGAFLSSPLRHAEEHPHWLLGAVSSRPRLWTASDVRAMEDAAERIRAAVERARSDKALRDSERLRSAALSGGRMGSWRWDRKADLIHGDGQFMSLWGLPPSEEPLPLATFAARMSAQGAAEMATIVAQAVAANEEFSGPLEIVSGPRAGHWVQWQGRAEPDEPSVLFGVTLDITEQKAAEARLRTSEAKYRTLFETVDEGLAIVEAVRDDQGHTVDLMYREVNPAYSDMAGFEARAGQRVHTVLPNLEDRWLERIDRVLETGSSEHVEGTIIDTGRWYRVAYSRIGGPGSLLAACVIRDITDRMRAEQTLRESEERQTFLLKLSDALRAEPNADAIANRALHLLVDQMRLDRCYITYYRPADDEADFPYQAGNDTVPPLPPKVRLSDFPDAYEQVCEKTLVIDDDYERHGVSEAERANSKALGTRAMLASTVRQGQNRPLASLVAVSSRPRHWSVADVTLVEDVAERVWAAIERARAEANVRESEGRFRQFGEASSDVIWIFNTMSGRLEYLSPAFDRIWGVPRATMLADLSRWGDTLHPDDRGRAATAMPRAMAGEVVTQEYRIVRGDGAIRYITDVGFPILDDAGRVVRVGGIAQDLTERRLAEEAVRASERRQRALVEGVPQLVWRAVDDGQWTWASPQWTEYTGQAGPDSHGRGWLEPIHPDDREQVRAVWRGAIEHGAFQAEYRIHHAAGRRYRWFQTRATPVRDDDGRIVEWLGTSTDVDDLRTLQDRQQVLAAELQHRVRNILAIIRSIIRRSLDGQQSAYDYAQHLEGRIDALARTQVLLTRRADARVNLEDLIRDELVAQAADDGRVELRGPDVALSPQAAEVLGLASHELATNAVKYGAIGHPGGTLTVEWSVEEREGERWLALVWRERGVPISVGSPRRSGFGTELVTRRVPYELKGQGALEMMVDGVVCTITFPLRDGSSVLETGDAVALRGVSE